MKNIHATHLKAWEIKIIPLTLRLKLLQIKSILPKT